jgi:AAA domain (dynein-related subfamily)
MRTASMTTSEAEAAIGPRGSTTITSTPDGGNRALAKKWLVAQGFPALFCGGLSLTELHLSYNDTSGKQVEKLRAKLERAKEDGDSENSTSTAAQEWDGDNQTHAEATRAQMGFTNGHDTSAASNGDTAKAKQLLALLGSIGGVDEGRVAAIVDKAISDALSKIPSVRIEIAQAGETVRTIDGHHHPLFTDLLTAACSRQVTDNFHPCIWIAGPAGSGKTHAAKMVAKAMGLQWHYNGAVSQAFDLVGFRDAGGTYHRTPLREAYEHGGVYLFDEVDGSDNSALLAVNALLANGTATFPDGQIQRHPDCVVIATANTWGLGATAEYVGRAKIDAAFLSRFPVRFGWDYDSALEVAISGNESFARRVIGARERARTAGLKVLIDPRASIAGAALIAQGMTSDQAARITYLANLNKEQVALVEGR